MALLTAPKSFATNPGAAAAGGDTTPGHVPEEVEVDGKRLPLLGLMEVLAVSRLIGDTDVLGGGGKNAGFAMERNVSGTTIAVRIVKIDPSESFNFDDPANQLMQSYNLRSRLPKLTDKRNCQFGNQQPLNIRWDTLSTRQQETFLITLSKGLKQLKDTDYLTRLIQRDGEFDQALAVVDEHIQEWLAYLEIQDEVYETELAAFAAGTDTAYSPALFGAAGGDSAGMGHAGAAATGATTDDGSAAGAAAAGAAGGR